MNPAPLPIPPLERPLAEAPLAGGRAAVFLTLVGVLLIVIGVNIGVRTLLEKHPQNPAFWLVKQKWRLLRADNGAATRLILGDSSGNQSVIPHLVDAALGGKTINLCTVGEMGIVDDAWMLNERLRSGRAPSDVVLIFTHDVWESRVQLDLLAAAPLKGAYWKTENPALDLSLRDRVRLELVRWAPLITQEKSVRKLLLNPRRPPTDNTGAAMRLDDRGYMPRETPRPDLVRIDTADHIRNLRGRRPRFSDANIAAMNQLALLADTNGIRLWLVHGPVHDRLAEDAGFRSYLGDLARAFTNLAKAHPSVRYVQEVCPLPENELEIADHPAGTGAETYTRWLTGKLSEGR